MQGSMHCKSTKTNERKVLVSLMQFADNYGYCWQSLSILLCGFFQWQWPTCLHLFRRLCHSLARKCTEVGARVGFSLLLFSSLFWPGAVATSLSRLFQSAMMCETVWQLHVQSFSFAMVGCRVMLMDSHGRRRCQSSRVLTVACWVDRPSDVRFLLRPFDFKDSLLNDILKYFSHAPVRSRNRKPVKIESKRKQTLVCRIQTSGWMRARSQPRSDNSEVNAVYGGTPLMRRWVSLFLSPVSILLSLRIISICLFSFCPSCQDVDGQISTTGFCCVIFMSVTGEMLMWQTPCPLSGAVVWPALFRVFWTPP